MLNSGSSSIKIDLIDIVAGGESKIASGRVQRSGNSAGATYRLGTAPEVEFLHERQDPALALREFVAWVEAEAAKAKIPKLAVDAIGHRVVHGGVKLRKPARIDESVLAELDRVTPLAPLHNPPALAGIRAAQEVFGAATPNVAVFDTAFHSTIPAEAATYALPHALGEQHGIRKYGFHGIAHESLMQAYAAATGRSLAKSKLITLQLGQGCSATAIRNGESIDTSMGFTPLEGLIMGTRPGDLDASIIPFLTGHGIVSPDQIGRWLNQECGLKGVSGLSGDFTELWNARATSDRAALAIGMFCYRIRKYVGAFMTTLGGAEAIIFGGGIGENRPGIRSNVCRDMEWCGVKLDEAKNQSAVGQPSLISSNDSLVQVWVLNADESSMIARKTFALLNPG